ncbi:elastase-1-like [Esox lucius]|uniref:pancreatic elastase n=1 Tax=Esox lucius TaxID=8010 RepID=A0A3P8YH70_ESOLU|nr:elastase-1-like [Esox lucius]
MLRFILLSALAALVLTEDLVSKPKHLEEVPRTKVVGGGIALPNSWPWQVSLLVKSGVSYFQNCGGILIRTGWVLTAASCVDSPKTLLVVLGEYNLNSIEGTEQLITVSRIIIHPLWNKNLASGNDIALLQLSTPATLNSAVQLAALPPSGQILPNNYACYISGWGSTYTGGLVSNSLRQAYLPIVDYQTCSSPSWWGAVAKPNMICAGGSTNSACNGDSGGPLNCQVGGRYYVHGVTSFVSAAGCNTFQKPTGFTRVSAYISWITGFTG